MNILQLCSKVPFPSSDGGSLAMHMLTEGLLKLGADVKILSVSTYKHHFNETHLTEAYKNKTQAEAVFIDTRIKPVDAFINLFKKESYNIKRFYSKTFDNRLIEILKKNTFDIVQLETLYMAPYVNTIRKYTKAKIVLRSHNTEYKIWERSAENSKNPLAKWYLNFLAERLKTYELAMINCYDAIATITEDDAEIFKLAGCTKPIITIPFGLDLKNFEISGTTKQEFPSAFHLGAMNWGPNIEGVKWLIENVWGKVISQQPSVKLYLAGRFMPDWLIRLNKKNIVVVGEVKSQFEFMQSKGIMLVPLFAGGGMRVKIIEGMACGKTIISTTIGAEGVPYEHKKNILIANTAEEFADHISLCVNNPELYKSIGQNAVQLIKDHFDNNIISLNLFNFYKSILSQ